MRRLRRYAGVSVISTAVSLAVLTLLVGTDAVTAGWANVIATGVGTVPSFELNRRWVWGRSDHRSAGSQVLPFCALSFLGLALSTLTVSAASGWAGSVGIGAGGLAVVADLTSLATFGLLWVLQYLLLDRVLFADRPAADRPLTGRRLLDYPPDRRDHVTVSRAREVRPVERG